MTASSHMWLSPIEVVIAKKKKFLILINFTVSSDMWLVAFILNSRVLRSYQKIQTQKPMNFSQHSLSKSTFQHSTLSEISLSCWYITLFSSYLWLLSLFLTQLYPFVPRRLSIALRLLLIFLHFKFKTVTLINFILLQFQPLSDLFSQIQSPNTN